MLQVHQGRGFLMEGTSADCTSDEVVLIKRIGLGDRGAFAELYEQYRRRLFRYFVKLLRNAAQADELSNEVLLDVWRGARNYQGRSSPSTWIFGIAHHKAVDQLRKTTEQAGAEELIASIEDPAPGPIQELQADELTRVIKDRISMLSSEHREVLALTYYQGFSVEETADILACPVNTVKTRMFYARQRLKDLLRAAGITGTIDGG